MLEVHAISCERGERLLFSDLSFTLNPGELLRVAGVNGSGKTTLLRLLSGLAPPDEGDILWNGKAIHRSGEVYRSQMSYIGHNLAVKLELTPLENLQFAQALGGLESKTAFELILDNVGLYGFEYDLCRTLSQGQRRRVALARLVFSTAKLWILDEPFVALDVKGVEFIAGLLAAHTDKGGMVILTTHQDTPLRNQVIKELHLND
ncbi:MAG: cytochrome c biogenesis heme-transporting ATPase CcmA [Thiotrichales bacterium]